MRILFTLFVFLCVPYLRIHYATGDDASKTYPLQPFHRYIEEQEQDEEENKMKKYPAFCNKGNFNVGPKALYYIHDLYCQRRRSPLYRFFFAQYTTSTLYYYVWVVFSTILKKFIGVYKKYKTWRDFEFYYGSVVGFVWYPQPLVFAKNFRIGFFDIFINFIYVFLTCCHISCKYYFSKIGKACKDAMDRRTRQNFLQQIFSNDNQLQNQLLDLYGQSVDIWWENVIKGTASSAKDSGKGTGNYQPVFLERFFKMSFAGLYGFRKGIEFFIKLFFIIFINLSLINIETCYGIKIKMLTLLQIKKFFKRIICTVFSNVCILRASKVERQHCFGAPGEKDAFIYIYNFDSHFSFGERDNIFWLILELFLPNIEINIGELFKK